ncbi:MAG TPA: DUF1549 and DUF1553 domain-containing protein [Pirellulales bacterium]|jgi:hypothetical protein|nr:DUF1549 and DUF1553 domain-containing protein [Pirellulales bacterium]
MISARWKLAIVIGCFAVASLPGTPGLAGAKPTSAAAVAPLAARIDEHLARAAERAHGAPAPQADDAEFLRRLCLDLGGRIPAVSEVREFLGDPSADKRSRKVDQLLDEPRYVSHFAQVWRRVLVPEKPSDDFGGFYFKGFDAWLEQRLRDDTPYDVMVWQLLTVPLEQGEKRLGVFERFSEPTPLAFYQVKQAAPENLAAATARVFLGVRIECAQCHNHPFDSWKQEQFWSFAAFFAGIERRQPERGLLGQVNELFDRREIGIPGTAQVVQAAYLDGAAPRWKFRVGSRQALADWVTSRDNPWFSRMAVNRLWAHFFGRGLVEPVDDFAASNPASHPELLDELGRALAEQGFDLKFLIRAVVSSQAYQRTSRRSEVGREDPALFARMALKALSAEQVLASLHQATGLPQPAELEVRANIDPSEVARGDLLDAFGDDTQPVTQRQSTILQALAMMNGIFISRGVDLERRRMLSAVLDDPSATNTDRLDTLYLATLSRFPSQAERQRMLAYVDQGGPRHDSRHALADVFWALLNSTEFVTNH